MGRIIAIASQKGGVGKTTTALNLGFSLSRFHGRTLLIDADPQGGMGIASNLKKRTTLGLVNFLRNECKATDIIAVTRDQTMGVVGAGVIEPEDAIFLEEQAANGNLGKAIRILAGDHVYTIVDAPAGVGGLVSSLLSISDGVLLPVTCRNITVKTLPNFLKLIRSVQQKSNPSLRLEGVVITMKDDQSATQNEILDQMKLSFPPDVFFRTVIPMDEFFEQASMRAVPVAMISGGGEIARSYLDLAMELKERELQHKTGDESDEDTVGLF
jgi:chromosome partitioning protein